MCYWRLRCCTVSLFLVCVFWLLGVVLLVLDLWFGYVHAIVIVWVGVVWDLLRCLIDLFVICLFIRI